MLRHPVTALVLALVLAAASSFGWLNDNHTIGWILVGLAIAFALIGLIEYLLRRSSPTPATSSVGMVHQEDVSAPSYLNVGSGQQTIYHAPSSSRREETPAETAVRLSTLTGAKVSPFPLPTDPQSWRNHTNRIKTWAQSQWGAISKNGLPNPGYTIDFGNEGDGSLFKQHFKDHVVPDIEGWNRAITRCRNAFRAAEVRALAENDLLNLIREQSGWPFRMMVIEHAGGLPAVVERMHFEWGDGCVIDRSTGGQVHPNYVPSAKQKAELVDALALRRHETAKWKETIDLGTAWREVEVLRGTLRNDFARIETFDERLPGECDRCPDRMPSMPR